MNATHAHRATYPCASQRLKSAGQGEHKTAVAAGHDDVGQLGAKLLPELETDAGDTVKNRRWRLWLA